jgi:hypothetical protein
VSLSRPTAWTLGALIAFRVALTLAVLAATGHRLLPGFPVYEYDPLNGDAYGYYSAAREIIATLARRAPVIAPVVLVAAAVVYFVRRRGVRGPALVVTVAWALAVPLAVVAAVMRSSGAPTIGWPLVWSVPLLPLRVLGVLDPDVAFAAGLALSLALIAAVVVLTYLLGLAVMRDPRIALAGAALFALWPLIALLLGGHRGTENGTWQGELGLSIYTEPLSTALVLGGLTLVLRPGSSTLDVTVAGALLGYAVAVRLSDVFVLGCVVVALAAWGRVRDAAWMCGAAAAFAPLVLAYWPKGYAELEPPTFPAHPFSISYVPDAWTDTLLWRPTVLLVLIPLALVGIRRASRPAAILLWSCVAVTAVFFSLYRVTAIHPRFFFVVLPIVLLFWAAGAAEVGAAVRRRTTIGAA